MTREEIYDSCIDQLETHKHILLELATGFGKSKLSIDLANYLIAKDNKEDARVLLLIYRKTNVITWRDELKKWGGINAKVEIICYASIHKYKGRKFDVVIADECHHLSEEKLMYLHTMKVDHIIGLSATAGKIVTREFRFMKAGYLSCNLNTAIESQVLPEPTIVLLPQMLDNVKLTESIELNARLKGNFVEGSLKYLPLYIKQRRKVRIWCTKQEYYDYLTRESDKAKRTFQLMKSEISKNRWLRLCGQRLEFLSSAKVKIVRTILKKLENERTITFCKTIEQCEELGSNSIHSKKKDATAIYESFNAGKIDHITAVNILNEGANLVNCKYAIFDNLTSSEVSMVQRLGRSMRHRSPVVIVPYFKNTREEELVNSMCSTFNPEFIKTVDSVEDL